MNQKKVAIMQPYLFPYLGYFQLVNAVDNFVFYDDVQYIKNGFINRNYLLVNNKKCVFTVPTKSLSHKDLIKDVNVIYNPKWIVKFNRTLTQNYSKAKYFEAIYECIQNVFKQEFTTISDLAINSIKEISDYLGLDVHYFTSSKEFSSTLGLDRADRLIKITQELNSEVYINPSGGKSLYSKDYFKGKSIDLKFIEPDLQPYQQFTNNSIVGLSIIDVLMFNSIEETRKMLQDYTLS